MNRNLKNIKLKKFITLSIIIFTNTLWLSADPKPGDVFREYHFANGNSIHLCVKGVTSDSTTIMINVDDLKGAVRAELTALFHTGHIGTSNKKFRINDGIAFDIPAAEIPFDNKDCYFTYIFGRPSVEVPLKDIKEGENQIKFLVGPQTCHGFNWPCSGFHSLVLRIYYDSSKPHPTGVIQYPQNGHVITNDELMIKAKVQAVRDPISSVDIVGYYYDYPFEGSGKYLDWHYLMNEYGGWMGFINRSEKSPYHETWDLKWLPDQDQPIKLMARITDNSGLSYMTAAVDSIILKREDHSVKMYKTTDVPENFKVRVNETMQSHFEPIDNLSNVSEVMMASIISIGHMDGKYLSYCGINDTKIRQYEALPNLHGDFFYNTYLPVKPAILKKGVNEFFVHSDTEGHMTEVCWPGPALLVRFEKASAKVEKKK